MRDKLVEQLNHCGYKGKIDFLYLPIDFRTRRRAVFRQGFRLQSSLVDSRFHAHSVGCNLLDFAQKE